MCPRYQVWVALFVYGGYHFGNLPVVKANFSLVILAVILLSLVPIGVEWGRSYLRAARAQHGSTQSQPR